jgi:hypothetical protein
MDSRCRFGSFGPLKIPLTRKGVGIHSLESAHGETGTEKPEKILCLGAIKKHKFAACKSREGAADIEDKHGVLLSLSVKK